MLCGRWRYLSLAALLAPALAVADGDGLAARADQLGWGGSAQRVAPMPLVPVWRASLAPAEQDGLRVSGLNVLGDLYLAGSASPGLRAQPSGFHATSGLLIGSRSQPWGAAPITPAPVVPTLGERRAYATTTLPYTAADIATDSVTVPYLGFGYSALSAKSGWSFNADLGMMSLSPGGVVRFGRAGNGNQGLDDLVRDMRLTPVLQLGVSYSF